MRLVYTTAACIFLFAALTRTQNILPLCNVNDASVRILFLGDLDFGESYQTNPRYNRGVNILDEYGYDYLFENINGFLKNSDLTIANLETPLVDSPVKGTLSRKPYVHWSRADKTAEYLLKYNITALSLANNHTFDYGAEGLNKTMKELKNNRLTYFGAGINIDEAGKPLIAQFIVQNDTVTIAVITGFEYRKSYDSIYNFYTGENKPGVNKISVERITEQIIELKEKFRDVYIIFLRSIA